MVTYDFLPLQEWRHAHGMRCLGIPNTAHFANVTLIEDALACKYGFYLCCARIYFNMQQWKYPHEFRPWVDFGFGLGGKGRIKTQKTRVSIDP